MDIKDISKAIAMKDVRSGNYYTNKTLKVQTTKIKFRLFKKKEELNLVTRVKGEPRDPGLIVITPETYDQLLRMK